jgi:2-keto-3-deoxy-L-rhamnonate aldolase RhmA
MNKRKGAEMRTNKVKHRIDRGEKALGFNVDFPAANVTDMLGHDGLDNVFFDTHYG